MLLVENLGKRLVYFFIFIITFSSIIFLFNKKNIVKANCQLDYSQIDGNLISNPYFECDEDGNNVPDGWTKYAEDNNHILELVDDPIESGKGKVLKSEYIDNGNPNAFGWKTSSNITIKPNTWYEFTFTYLTRNIGLNLIENKISNNTNWLGASVLRFTDDGTQISQPPSNIFVTYPDFNQWDNTAQVYRSYSYSNSSGWTTKKIFFKTSQFDSIAVIRNYNYPPGVLYIENLTFREANDNINPEYVPFKKFGTLPIFTFRGNKYFPIILYQYPKLDGQDIDITEIKNTGFNTVPSSYRGFPIVDYQALLKQTDFATIVKINCLPWSSSGGCNWVNDPLISTNYTGYDYAINTVNGWKDFDGTLIIEALRDEMDCNPQTGATYPNFLGTFTNLVTYIQENTNAYTYGNFCGGDSYTDDFDDKSDYYLPIPDVFTLTRNTPTAYDMTSGSNVGSARLQNAGFEIRRGLETMSFKGLEKRALAMGIGEYHWSTWNGTFLENQYIPFNLQRFQIWDQIINGATGALFYTISAVNLDDPYYRHNFNQIKSLTKELSSLKDVLIEEKYHNEWTVSNSEIEVMMKKYNSKIYLFTTSTAQENLSDIEFTIDEKYKILSISALNDIENGNFENPITKTIHKSSDNSFYDNFIGEDTSSPQGYYAPGYATHIYEISYINQNGDINEDGVVNMDDYQILIDNFSNPYTIYDYNNLISNWGKTIT